MALYIALSTFTDQGIHHVKDTTKRTEAAQQMGKKMGVNMTQIFWTLGQYDLVSIIEAPNDESAAAFGLAIGAGGNVRTETMRAFTQEDMAGIIAKMA
jgi:uncharacterized protein with GYD domain